MGRKNLNLLYHHTALRVLYDNHSSNNLLFDGCNQKCGIYVRKPFLTHPFLEELQGFLYLDALIWLAYFFNHC